MTFRSRDLSVLAYANGFTLWHYRTGDDGATVLAAGASARESGGYFDSAGELLQTGDRIMVSLLQGNQPAMLDLVVTAAAPDSGVAVAPAGIAQPDPPPVKGTDRLDGQPGREARAFQEAAGGGMG